MFRRNCGEIGKLGKLESKSVLLLGHFVVLSALFLIGAPNAAVAYSQRARALISAKDSEFDAAQNRWRLTSVDVSRQRDTVDHGIRSKRSAAMLPILQEVGRILTPEGPEDSPPDSLVGLSIFGGALSGDSPELPIIRHAIWIIAKFESFRVYAADPQETCSYTEINFRVKTVIRHPDSLALAPGTLLDFEIPGGRIRHSDGSVTLFDLFPAQHYYQPGHTYLLEGTVDPNTEWLDLNKVWDVTTGRIESDSPIEKLRARAGKSILIGSPVGEAVEYLKRVLPDSND